MDQPPARSHATFLTDDELLIFDFLTLGTIPFGCMLKDEYPFHMNCGYTHDLTNAQLLDSMTSLSQLRLVNFTYRKYKLRGRPPSPKRWFSFTPDGAELWEKEREPDWSQFVAFPLWDKTRLILASPNRTVAETCLSVGVLAGRWKFDEESLLWQEKTNFRWRGWHTFPSMWVATAQKDTQTENLGRRNWKLYEENRTWWESINHLPRNVKRSIERRM